MAAEDQLLLSNLDREQEQVVKCQKSSINVQELAVLEQGIAVLEQGIAVLEQGSAVLEQELAVTEQELAVTEQELEVTDQELDVRDQELDVRDQELAVRDQELAVTDQELAVTEHKLAVTEQELTDKELSTDLSSLPRMAAIRVDPADGTVYEWDSVQRGWFPQLNEDMIAAYTMSYGSTERSEVDNSEEIARGLINKRENEEREVNTPIKRVKNEVPTWFEVEESQNKHVYVSNLPSNTTEQQFTELMRKCGVISEHADGRAKVKLYKTQEGELKGDALCTYLKVESVPYAELILDGYEMEGHKLRVQPAVFEMKGEYNASLKPKKNKKNKKNRAEKLVKWKDPFYDRPKHERVVILKNVFGIEELAGDPLLSEQVRIKIKGECEKCGKVKRAIVCERQPEGVVSVMFMNHTDADRCVQAMQGRAFGGRLIECSLWDGETQYVAEETEGESKSRLDKWEEYLNK